VAAIISVVETCRRLKIPVRDYLGSMLPGLGDPKLTNQIRRVPTVCLLAGYSTGILSIYINPDADDGLIVLLELRLNPGLERAFQPRGFLLPLQAAAIMQKNVVKSAFGSASSRRRAQNVAIRIVHIAIADLFCASQSGSLQVVHLPRDWTTGSFEKVAE
jgi:hypothetical protein